MKNTKFSNEEAQFVNWCEDFSRFVNGNKKELHNVIAKTDVVGESNFFYDAVIKATVKRLFGIIVKKKSDLRLIADTYRFEVISKCLLWCSKNDHGYNLHRDDPFFIDKLKYASLVCLLIFYPLDAKISEVEFSVLYDAYANDDIINHRLTEYLDQEGGDTDD